MAEVETWAGIAEAIILHVEVEARDKQTLPQRTSEYYVLLPTAEIADPREEIMQKLMDIEVSWGDRLRQIGRDEGLKEGRDEGLKEGEQKMLLRMLSLMFGELPATVVTRINAITDEETLAMLAKQILTIKQLDELVLPDSK